MASTRDLVVAYGSVNVLYGAADKLFGSGYVAAMAARGLDASQIGVVLATGSAVLALADYPSGNLADGWGRKRTTVIGFLLLGASLLWYSAAGSFGAFVLAMAGWAVGVALISGSPVAWLVDELAERGASRARETIIPKTQSVTLVAGGLAALAAVPLLARGAGVAVLAAGVVALATAVVVVALFRENYGERGPVAALPRQLVDGTRALATDPAMRLIMMKTGARHVGFTVFILSWQLYVTQKLGLPASALGLLLALSIATMALGSFLVPWAGRMLPLILVSAVGQATIGVGFAVMALSPHAWVWYAGLVLFQVGLGLDFGSSSTWVHDFIPTERRASWISALSSVQTLVGIAGTLAAGELVDRIGFTPVWLAAAGLTLVGVVPTLALQSLQPEPAA